MIIGSPFRIRVTSMNPSGFPSTEMSKASVKYLSKKGLLRASQEENWEENMSARSFWSSYWKCSRRDSSRALRSLTFSESLVTSFSNSCLVLAFIVDIQSY